MAPTPSDRLAYAAAEKTPQRPALACGKMLSVAVEWFKFDKYGRKLGKVLLAGLDCNLVQVKRGLISTPGQT